MANYTELVCLMRKAFRTGRTKSYEWRYGQLNSMLRLIDENMVIMCDSLKKDLNKHKFESIVFEINMVRGEVIYMMNNLKEWMKPEKVKKDLLNVMDTCYIKREPFGVALVIGAWNYPVQLVLLPMIAALSAGNCVIIKPSEMAEETSLLFEKLMPQYFDNDCVKVVQGGVTETTLLLKERFDYIFYTGNSVVAKIIMAAAAKNLTPVTLELGGKSPVYVDRKCNLRTVAKRLMWGKFANAGQTCIAPDFVMCPQDVQDPLIAEMGKVISEFYTENPAESECYGRIINDRHFQRVKKLLSSGTIAIGGDVREEDRFISPTILRDCQLTDPAMQEEIFGPILPVYVVQDDNEAVELINDREKPLAMYIFSRNQSVVDNFVNNTSSGGMCINDTLMHAALCSLPFGGIGNSGTGSYHGKFSYDTFSHKRSVLHRDLKLDSVNTIRYPPYTDRKLSMISWLTKKSVKKSGLMSFFPLVMLGTILAVFMRTLGVYVRIPSFLKGR